MVSRVSMRRMMVVPWWRVRSRVRHDGYDVDEEDGRQNPGGE